MVSLSDILAPVLNGTDEFFSVDDASSIGDGVSPLSLCMWFRFNSGFSGIQPIFSKWNIVDDNRSYYLLYDPSVNSFKIGISTNGAFTNEVIVAHDIDQNFWIFVTLRMTGTEIQLLVDGCQIASFDSDLPFDSTAPLLLGSHLGDFLDGSLTILSTYKK